MPLSSDDRATTVYNALSKQSGFSVLNQAEQAQMLTMLKTLYQADTGYLTSSATITPGSLANNAGQAVQVTPASGTGSTSAPQTIVGTGRLT
ncbi:MAG: hypothetical protein EOO38_00100 [Cytophagaceae bacterium]|nr:MAG: hypothetical protein EOO38_00100 [Cytophagaceae bacterium]